MSIASDVLGDTAIAEVTTPTISRAPPKRVATAQADAALRPDAR